MKWLAVKYRVMKATPLRVIFDKFAKEESAKRVNKIKADVEFRKGIIRF